MDAGSWRFLAVLLFLFVRFASASKDSCARVSAFSLILPLPPPRVSCSAAESPVGVVEGDQAALQMALNLVYKSKEEFVAVLFHACWCPFSKVCRPNFNVLSSLFPAIRHFAFEEFVIRPSILSRYGVHGFPTMFLLNSTMRVRYHGSRNISSLVGFYSDVTGIRSVSLNPASTERAVDSLKLVELEETIEPEKCPFSWTRSPEKLLQEDTYLALASSFVLLRLLYFLVPKLNYCFKRTWSWQMQYASLMSLWDHFQAYIIQAKQGLNSRLKPCKRSNLQEGAMNAKAWASKSLASVSIGEPSSSRTQSTS